MHICASKDRYGAVSENCEGIYAAGDDIKATKNGCLRGNTTDKKEPARRTLARTHQGEI